MFWAKLPSNWAFMPVWRSVSKRTDTSVAEVLGCAVFLFCHSSSAADRGSISDIDPESIALSLGIGEERVLAIVKAMTEKKLFLAGRWTGWDDLQPKDATAAERQKRYRDRQKERATLRDVTGNGTAHNVEEKREDQRDKKERGELNPPSNPSAYGEGRRASVDLFEAVRLWNLFAEQFDLPKVQKLTEVRNKKLAARLHDVGGIDGWVAVLETIQASPGLLGKGKDGWKINFDWLMNEASFVKVVEGNYKNWSGMKNKLSEAIDDLFAPKIAGKQVDGDFCDLS